MKRFGAGLVGTLLALSLVPGSVAAADFNEHGTDQGAWVEDDFCGTGVAVEHVYTNTFTVHAFQLTARGQDIVTNPQTGDSIVGSFAGVTRGEFSGDPDGLHTITFTHAGLPESIKTSTGSVLIVDAGRVVSVLTFDGDEFISEVNVANGRHDDLENPGLFCEVTTRALGIG
jgi:hypothetical protein